MFKVDMAAICDAAIEARLMANSANEANPALDIAPSLANLAALAIGHEYSTAIDPVLADLLEASMRACNAWNDSEAARADMRRGVRQTPPHLRADLLDHFTETYPGLPTTGREDEQ